jgi:hypothetical protein
MSDPKKILINMNSQSETFTIPNSIYWDTITLEGCNLVAKQADDNYIVHIEEITEDVIICDSGESKNKVGTFLVGPQPFNPSECQTIKNHTPDRPLNRLTVSIHTTKGNPATINDKFYIALRID